MVKSVSNCVRVHVMIKNIVYPFLGGLWSLKVATIFVNLYKHLSLHGGRSCKKGGRSINALSMFTILYKSSPSLETM